MSIINQKFQTACAKFFNFHTGWKIGYSTRHMLNYTETAYKKYKKNQEWEKSIKEKNKNEDEQNEREVDS